METPYLDREIKTLEQGLKDKTNSFYQNRKVVEYKELKKQLALLRVSCQREQLKAQKLKDLKNWLQSDVKNIDSGIIKPKETELTRFKRKALDKVKEIESL